MNAKTHPSLCSLFVAALAVTALPTTAQIDIENSSFEALPDQAAEQDFENVPYTVSFSAGAADKVVVTLSSEGGNTATITYAGEALTRIPDTATGRNRGIWYLDLAGTGYVGGPADLTFDLTANGTVNGIGYTVTSLVGTAPGFGAANVASGLEVTLDVPDADSYLLTNHGANGGAPMAPASHFQIYSAGIGSARGASSDLVDVPAGMLTVTYTTNATNNNVTSAATFSPNSDAAVLLSLTPADNATNVAANSNLTATYSETVSPGSGNIELWEAGGGSALETFDVTSSGQLTFSGADLIIDPTNDLAAGTEYYVLIDTGAVVDNTGGNSVEGITDPATWSFTVDGPPLLSSTNPADDATNVSVGSNLVANFNETIFAGTGTIELWEMGGGSALESFDAATSPQLTFDGANLTIDPTDDLAADTEYYIVIDGSAVEDATGNTFAGLSAPPTDPNWSFTTDNTPPEIIALDPADGAEGLFVSVDLTATFSESVAAGTGTIQLWEAGGGSAVESFDVASSSQLTFAGSTLTIDPTSDLVPDGEYYVLIDPTAVEDASGNAFAGIADPATWNFSAGPASGVAISVVNNDFLITRSITNSPPILSFDAGAAADMLVVALSSEKGGGSYAVTYNGVPLTLAIAGAGGATADIWYLPNPFTGGAAELAVDFTGVSPVNGVGMGVISLSAGGGDILLHSTANGGGGSNSVDLTTSSGNCFTIACTNTNGVNGTMVVDAPMTELFANANIGSARGAAGYELNVAAGTHTYSFTVPDSPRSTVAAAFVAVPGTAVPVITDIEVTSGGDVILTTDVPASSLITKKADSLEDVFVEVPSTETGANERTINAADVDLNADGLEFYVVE